MTATFQRVLFGLVFLFVMVNVHEVGHTTVARLLGDDSAHYVLYQVQGQSGAWAAISTTRPDWETSRTFWSTSAA